MKTIESAGKILAGTASGEEVFSLLFRRHPIPMWIYDLETLNFLDLNDAAVEKYGYNREEFLKMTIKDIRPAEDVAGLLNDMARIRSELSHSGEWRHKLRDGRTIDVEITSHTLEYSGHKAAMLVAQDITERKHADQIVRDSEKRFRAIFDQSPVAIALLDMQGHPTISNLPLSKMLGYSNDELSKMKFIDFTFPEDADKDLNLFNQLIEGRISKYSMKKRYVHKNGNLIWTNVSVTMARDERGIPLEIIGMAEDITERKQAEEAVRASEEKYRALFEESKDCICIGSAEGKLLDINAAGIEMFGYGSKQEALQIDMGRNLYADSQQWAEFLSRINEQGFVKDFEATMKRKNGQKLTVLQTATAVRDTQGKIVALRGTIRDVTRQKQLEHQVEQAKKMDSLGLLAGAIAHDFNNILNIILVHTALVDHAGNDPATLKESVSEITTAVQRGVSLVRQILTFARKSDATDEVVRVNATIRELGKMIADTFPKTISIALDLDETIPVIVMDQTQLHQALLNLCVNARDAITESSTEHLGRGEIRIQTSIATNSEVRKKFSEASAREYVCIAVSDSGKGMDEETKQKIYEPFFTTKEQGKGTGLGLSVVYGIIKARHGHIEVESDIGCGTTFRFYLPVVEAIATRSMARGEDTLPEVQGKETILLVQDEHNLQA
jgi:two-component system, cell cycle sensor histidine kinase and response regulator CckA